MGRYSPSFTPASAQAKILANYEPLSPGSAPEAEPLLVQHSLGETHEVPVMIYAFDITTLVQHQAAGMDQP